MARPQSMALSQLIDAVNERFGMSDEGLRQAAAVNPGDKFELVFKHLLESLFIERMDQSEEIFVRYMNDAPFQRVVTAWMAAEAYRRLRGELTRQSTLADSPTA